MKKNALQKTCFALLVFCSMSRTETVCALDTLILPQCPQTAVCGEEITIPVEIVDSPEIASLGMDIVFPNDFIYQGCEKEGCLTEEFQFFDCNVSSQSGNLKVGGFTLEPIPEGSNGCLVTVTFSIDEVCTGPFTISLANLVDNIKDVQTESCQMTVGSSTTTTGNATTSASTTSTTAPVTSTVDPTTTTSAATTTTTIKICPARVSLASNYSGVAKLRAFRDYFLSRHPLGEKYNDLYYKHALEVSGYLLDDPLLRCKSAAIISGLLPTIDSLMSGETTTIDPGLISEAVLVIDQLELLSSEPLKRDLTKLRRDLSQGVLLNQLGITIAKSDY